jgi:hypothetical protein
VSSLAIEETVRGMTQDESDTCPEAKAWARCAYSQRSCQPAFRTEVSEGLRVYIASNA